MLFLFSHSFSVFSVKRDVVKVKIKKKVWASVKEGRTHPILSQ